MVLRIKNWLASLFIKIILFLSKIAKIDLLPLAYKEIGLMKSYGFEASGEKFLIETYLKQKIKKPAPVFLDIGANVGSYSKLLRDNFPQATIYAFEPNPHAFKKLKEKCEMEVHCFNIGFGEVEKKENLYTIKDNLSSINATLDPDILKKISKRDDFIPVEVQIRTLDDFCREEKMAILDFLKIDTEGFELEVLKGASGLLKQKKIPMIQFEFNEVNIVKRVFLRDFYEFLSNYEFYRINTDGLVPLGNYRPIHEIFLFQNILAVQK